MKIKYLILSLLAISISGCSYFEGEPEKPPLPGERISILDLQKDLSPSDGDASAMIMVPPAARNKEWPQSGGYPSHRMQNLALGDADKLGKIWSADIGAGSDDRLPLTAQPIIADGRIYTLDTKSYVRAFHNQTGKMLWETSVRHEVEEDPVISGGIAFAGGVIYVTSGYDEVLALNPTDGAIYWRTPISAGSRAAPTIHNGRVFVTGLNNNVIAIGAKDGKVLWEYEGVGETTGLLGAASPAADETMVIPALSSGELVALRTENGSIIWNDSLANSLRLGGIAGLSDIRGLPVINGDMVIAISYGGKMAAFDKRNGVRIWQRDISSSETPWVAGNTVYILSADYKLIALNISNGEILWVTQLRKYQNEEDRKGLLTWAGPIMVGGRLLIAGTDGRMVEFNPKDGSQTASWSAGKTIRISPVVADGALYLLAEDGSLLAYR